MTDPAQIQKPSGKEREVIPGGNAQMPALKEVGHEMLLLAEVSGAGVKIHPTTVQMSQNVTQMGVKAVGQATPPPAISVTLPLTDEQIAQGLHQSIMSSWRWMAEWCVRRLKQVHLGFKIIHGKIMRVKYA